MRGALGGLAALALAAGLGFGLPAAAGTPVNHADAAKLKSYVDANGLACMSCHSIQQKEVGPAWINVAKKYQGNSNAIKILSNRIANGGSGTWGSVPMPPGMATPQQAKHLAGLIMALPGEPDVAAR